MPIPKILPASILCLLLLVATPAPSSAQCILANPSFELSGSSGEVFGGWSQFGNIGSVSEASHGQKAARISGPDSGVWDLSGFWQPHDCAVGEQFEVTGHVYNPSSNPLSGGCVALVNVEWRDSGANLIGYNSYTVADAGSPTDEWLDFTQTSDPAPAGTAWAHILVGVLQGPTDSSPDVYFDQITLFSTSSPTIDDVQWNDFPGNKTLTFGDRVWRIKGPGWYGPGYNYFCDSSSCVWVDEFDRLHLKMQLFGSTWACTEIVTEEALGYGDYILTTESDLDTIDPQTVLGMFLWEYGPCWDNGYLWWNAFNEVDIEYSRWGNPSSDIAQFVAQPWDYPGNRSRFDASFTAGEPVSHAMRWLADRVEYRVWRGGPDDESGANMIASWTYTGPHVPRPEQPRMHLNFWKLDGTPAGDQEIIFNDFTFIPAGITAVSPQNPVLASPMAGWIRSTVPNPFNPSTTIRYELRRDSRVEIRIYDASGRRVRRLLSSTQSAGPHEAVWNGLDDRGRALASGVYQVQLSGPDFVDGRAVTLVK